MSPSVLIVHRNAQIRRILSEEFARRGYRVGTARDGRQACDQLSFLLPDVIVADAATAEVDGPDPVRRLRGHDQGVPIVLTGARGRVRLPGVQIVPDLLDLGSVVGAVNLGLASRLV